MAALIPSCKVTDPDRWRERVDKRVTWPPNSAILKLAIRPEIPPTTTMARGLSMGATLNEFEKNCYSPKTRSQKNERRKRQGHRLDRLAHGNAPCHQGRPDAIAKMEGRRQDPHKVKPEPIGIVERRSEGLKGHGSIGGQKIESRRINMNHNKNEGANTRQPL